MIETPVGPLTTLVDADGVVLASGFNTGREALLALVHPTLRPAAREDDGPVADVVRAYFAGDPHALDAVPVRQLSGGFMMAAWDELRRVKPGSPITYTELAERTGRPAAVRAAAAACARNAVAPFVPCHRIVRTDGTLGGYRYTLSVKEWLLSHENDMRIV